ncbi:MAG: sigma-70 family RNA polymerase sigma factor [Candidatus Gastranaerophilales bacterium]|nr:sigma-70 family RNA polymerase sigma factor [Candidatus Gastranaerophilales bacterium]
MNKNDIILIAAAKNSDKKALEKLVKKVQPNIYATLTYLKVDHADIHDISQEIMLKVANKIHQLKKVEYFKIWLNKIMLNSYYDYLRKNKRDLKEFSFMKNNDNEILNIADNTENPQNALLNSELNFIIKASINNLPLQYKIPIALREFQGLSYDEISAITKTSIGTVKSRISRARTKIKDAIKKYSQT